MSETISSDVRGGKLETSYLRQLALDCGADDVGFVEIGRPALEDQRVDILRFYPRTQALLSFVCRLNREPIRSPARSAANLEFHHTGDHVNEVGRAIVRSLERAGIYAINPPMAFPMEASHWPAKMWIVSHKPVAVAAGLGMMGIHRNVIHPRFGNFILLGTVLLAAELTEYDEAIAYNPCLECKLCVAACPVGAIATDGHFDMSACYTHNYREFMGGFADWVEQVADAKSAFDYRHRVTAPETVSMWQSLAFGPNYKAAYCLAVCPAGEDVIGPYHASHAEFLKEVVKPLQNKQETVYVAPGSDAESYVAKRFPHKTAKRVRGTLAPRTIDGFLNGMSYTFQRQQSHGVDLTIHFTFTGQEQREATATIRHQELRVTPDHAGVADLCIRADSETWLGFLAEERSLVWALLRRKIRVRGSLRRLGQFGKCFAG